MDLIPAAVDSRLAFSRVHSDESCRPRGFRSRVRFSRNSSRSTGLFCLYGKTLWVIVRGRCLEDEHGNLLELIGMTIDVSAQSGPSFS